MKKKNLKIGLIVLLVMLMLGLTYTSFAYWDQLDQTDEYTVNIGEAVRVDVDFSTEDSEDNLIPETAEVVGPDDIDAITYTVTVNITQKVIDMEYDLKVTLSDLKIGDDNDVYDLVNVKIGAVELTDAVYSLDLEDFTELSKTLTVTVTLDEPADRTVYDAVFGKPITFKLTFAASAPVDPED